jgi:hypothetical protein
MLHFYKAASMKLNPYEKKNQFSSRFLRDNNILCVPVQANDKFYG